MKTICLLIFPVCLLGSLFAQVSVNSNWTWMHGDSIVHQPSVFGTQGIPNDANKPASRYGAGSWTGLDGNFYLYGGVGWNPPNNGLLSGLSDLWQYNPSTNQWSWLQQTSFGTQPGTVYGTKGVAAPANTPGKEFESVTWTANDGKFWLYDRKGILWRYETATNYWTWMKGDTLNKFAVYGLKGIESSSNEPGARTGAFGWKSAGGTFWLMGGAGMDAANQNGFYNDLWRFDPLTNNWTWMKGDSTFDKPEVYGDEGVESADNNPRATYFANTWVDGTGNFWLWEDSILWKFNAIGNNWTPVRLNFNRPASYGSKSIPAAANQPEFRNAPITWSDMSGNLWLMGGWGYREFADTAEGSMNDLWKFDPLTNYWTWIRGDSNFFRDGYYGNKGVTDPLNEPPSRAGGAGWRDSNGNLWLMGGYRNSGHYPGRFNALNDVWKLSDIPVLLPVKLLSFNAVRKMKVVELSWSTENENNSIGFDVQRKNDNNDYHKIAFVSSKANNNSHSALAYQFSDVSDATGISWYRLKQIDRDGKGTYSEQRMVDGFKTKSGITIYPNPSKHETITVSFNTSESKDIVLSTIDGRTVQKWTSYTPQVLKLHSLATGTYFLQVKKLASNETDIQKVVATH
jgi:hypothetical protein